MVALVVVEPINTMAVGVVMHPLVVQAAEGAEPLVMLAAEVKPVMLEVNQVALVRAAVLEALVL
jgi:hypothetical protein